MFHNAVLLYTMLLYIYTMLHCIISLTVSATARPTKSSELRLEVELALLLPPWVVQQCLHGHLSMGLGRTIHCILFAMYYILSTMYCNLFAIYHILYTTCSIFVMASETFTEYLRRVSVKRPGPRHPHFLNRKHLEPRPCSWN